MSITENVLRVGNLTSSNAIKLFSEPTAAEAKKGVIFGKGALTYIKERNHERRLGRSLNMEVSAKPTKWGKVGEMRVFELLPLEYTVVGDVTDLHPIYDFWSGSKDVCKNNNETVGDIKCPYTLASFCDLVHPLYENLNGMDAMNVVRNTHSEGEKYYQQIVSNACITGAKYGELIVYMPYKSELEDIKFSVLDDPEFMFIKWALDNELPFLPDGGYYKNLNTIRFEIPQSDKDILTKRMIEAGKLLINKEPSILIATHDPENGCTIVEPTDILSKLKKIKK